MQNEKSDKTYQMYALLSVETISEFNNMTYYMFSRPRVKSSGDKKCIDIKSLKFPIIWFGPYKAKTAIAEIV